MAKKINVLLAWSPDAVDYCDCALIGAGVRTDDDSVEAFQRWV